jgi:glutamine amidotransferase
LTFSLHTLAARGSGNGNTHDGWGVAFYQGHDVALFREPFAAGDSALVRYLESGGPGTNLAISHIRHATRGTLQLSNTQPFVRELAGRTHVFAHNGDLPDIERRVVLAPGSYIPVGQTDSEHAFCILLTRMRPIWEQNCAPPLEARMVVLAAFAAELRLLGQANFMYADGDALFTHSDQRVQLASGRVAPPGLWMLQRHCPPAEPASSCQAGVAIKNGERSALFVASVPLTEEAWQPMGEGELLAVRAGEVLLRWPAALG